MEYLIQKVKLIDPRSKFHQKTVDVLIQDQRIIDIKKKSPLPQKLKRFILQTVAFLRVGLT